MKLKIITLIILEFLIINNIYADDIYILGKVQKTDISKISALAKTIILDRKGKKVSLYLNNTITPIFTFTRNESSSYTLLEETINNLPALQEDLQIPTSLTILQYKNEITKKTKGKYLCYRNNLVFNKVEYDNFDKLLIDVKDFRNYKVHNLDYILIFQIPKPLLKINPIINKVTTKKNINISGSIISDLKLSKLELRINDGDWISISAKKEWSYNVQLHIGENEIEVRAMNSLNEYSNIETIKGIIYKKPELLPSLDIEYLNPNDSDMKVVDICRYEKFDLYFKIRLHNTINLDNLELIIKDSTKSIIRNFPLNIGQFQQKDVLLLTDSTTVCLYIPIQRIKTDPCDFDPEQSYYYLFKYVNEDNIEYFSRMIDITFRSFVKDDPKIIEPTCD